MKHKRRKKAEIQATTDIRIDLIGSSKIFIFYNRSLDPIMEELVKRHIENQKHIKHE